MTLDEQSVALLVETFEVSPHHTLPGVTISAAQACNLSLPLPADTAATVTALLPKQPEEVLVLLHALEAPMRVGVLQCLQVHTHHHPPPPDHNTPGAVSDFSIRCSAVLT